MPEGDVLEQARASLKVTGQAQADYAMRKATVKLLIEQVSLLRDIKDALDDIHNDI